MQIAAADFLMPDAISLIMLFFDGHYLIAFHFLLLLSRFFISFAAFRFFATPLF